VKYELEFYIPEDDILHSHRRENLKSYTNMNYIIETHGVHSALVRVNEELLERKVAAPV
jgi:hypothetical protein